MAEKYFTWSIQIVAFGTLFLTFLFMPKLARKGIVFGIRIPSNYMEKTEISRIIASYMKNYMFTNIPIVFLLMWLSIKFENTWVNLGGVIAFTTASFSVFYQSRKKVANLKKEKKWYSDQKTVAATDTLLLGKNRKRTVVSQWWFLIPISIVAFNFHILIKGGNTADLNFTVGNFLSVLLPYVLYEIIKSARQEIEFSDPEGSIERNIRFRKGWTGFLIFISIVFSLLITLHQVVSINSLTLSPAGMAVIDFAATVLILLVSVILAFLIGQGGSRIQIKKSSGKVKNEIDRDDDSYWKLGLFYFNPDDSAWFVEKRSMLGWTINWSKIPAILIVVCLIGLIPALCRLLGLE